jgi:hypothetical protein
MHNGGEEPHCGATEDKKDAAVVEENLTLLAVKLQVDELAIPPSATDSNLLVRAPRPFQSVAIRAVSTVE